MSRSGPKNVQHGISYIVLIPLLVDVPLWVCLQWKLEQKIEVLIPLLVDVPLWDIMIEFAKLHVQGLNPSFSGCPALGCVRATPKQSHE